MSLSLLSPRSRLWRGAVLLFTLVACSSDSSAPSAPGNIVGQCRAVEDSCSIDEDHKTTCCSGWCPEITCTEANLDFSATCGPAPCGGDLTGKWRIVGGCGPKECASSGAGAVRGSFDGVRDENGVYTGGASVFSHTSACGRDLTENPGISYTKLGGDGAPYCVQGDDLWILSGGFMENITALHMKRATTP